MVKELSAGELEAACQKCICVEVSDTKALTCVLDDMNVDYKMISDTAALAKENCEILSMQERDDCSSASLV